MSKFIDVEKRLTLLEAQLPKYIFSLDQPSNPQDYKSVVWFNPQKNKIRGLYADGESYNKPVKRNHLLHANTDLVNGVIAAWTLPSTFNTVKIVMSIRSLAASTTATIALTSSNAGWAAGYTSEYLTMGTPTPQVLTSLSFTVPAALRPTGITMLEIMLYNLQNCGSNNGLFTIDSVANHLPNTNTTAGAIERQKGAGSFTTTAGVVTDLRLSASNVVGKALVYYIG